MRHDAASGRHGPPCHRAEPARPDGHLYNQRTGRTTSSRQGVAMGASLAIVYRTRHKILTSPSLLIFLLTWIMTSQSGWNAKAYLMLPSHIVLAYIHPFFVSFFSCCPKFQYRQDRSRCHDAMPARPGRNSEPPRWPIELVTATSSSQITRGKGQRCRCS